jgi:hypothetical protein
VVDVQIREFPAAPNHIIDEVDEGLLLGGAVVGPERSVGTRLPVDGGFEDAEEVFESPQW